jgi:signal transduction histidine kinase
VNRRFVLGAALIVSAGVLSELGGDAPTLALTALDLTAGWALALGGLYLAVIAGRRRTGGLLMTAGLLWFAANLGGGAVLGFAHRAPLFQAAADDGQRPLRRPVLALAAGGYLGAWLLDAVLAGAVAGAVIAAVLLALAAACRRAPALIAACAYAVPAAMALSGDPALADAVRSLYAIGIAITAIVVVAAELARPAAVDVVIELADGRGVEAALAQALGDPTLALLTVPDPARGTVVECDGIAIGTIVHRPGLLADARLRAAALAAATLATQNVRLTDDLARSVTESAASTRRLVEAGDAQRRRLERRIDAGAESLLARADAELVALGPPAEDLRRRLDAARTELAELAAGLHPRALDHGLDYALEQLASTLPLPVTVAAETPPIPEAVATAAYFVCAEALANVAKHAQAARARVELEVRDGVLVAEVADDGIGGADPSASSGLHGLGDRCAALGGSLALESPAGGGTRVTARLPL